MVDLADAIEQHKGMLADRPIAEMYADDPFWERRFGAPGRRHANDDGRHHVTYLVEALRERDPARLVRYAHWLRTVLAARGMCTRHVIENLARMERLLDEIDVADPSPAQRYLQLAQQSLRYPEQPAGALLACAGPLARAALGRLPAGVRAEDARTLEDLAWYLADAVALERPDLLAAHVRWLDRDGTARLRQPHRGTALLDALHAVLREPPADALIARDDATLRAARDTLARATVAPRGNAGAPA